MSGDIALQLVAAGLLLLGCAGIGQSVTTLRYSVTRDPVWDVPSLLVGIILLVLACWIAAVAAN